MSIKPIIKKMVYYFCSAILWFIPQKEHALDSREENAEKLSMFAKDHQIYSKETFATNCTGFEKVDVDIIIPFFNAGEKYIRCCVGSLLSQCTYYSYRLICVDDGSEDDTLTVLRKYEADNPGKVVVIHQENEGISSARNKGVQLANATYIGFIDQDDWVKNDYVDALLEVAFKDNADVVKCSYCIIKDDACHSKLAVEKTVTIDGTDLRPYDVPGVVWGGVYNSDLFAKIRFPEDYWYEDMISRFLIYRSARVIRCVKEPLYNKRKHINNASSVLWNSKNVKSFDQLFLVKHLLEESRNLGLRADGQLKQILTQELGQYLVWRMRGQRLQNIRLAFTEACYLVEIVNGEIQENETRSNVLWDAFLKHDFNRWLVQSWKEWALDQC